MASEKHIKKAILKTVNISMQAVCKWSICFAEKGVSGFLIDLLLVWAWSIFYKEFDSLVIKIIQIKPHDDSIDYPRHRNRYSIFKICCLSHLKRYFVCISSAT